MSVHLNDVESKARRRSAICPSSQLVTGEGEFQTQTGPELSSCFLIVAQLMVNRNRPSVSWLLDRSGKIQHSYSGSSRVGVY